MFSRFDTTTPVMVDFSEAWFSSFEAPDCLTEPEHMIGIICHKNDVFGVMQSERDLERMEISINIDENIMRVNKTSDN